MLLQGMVLGVDSTTTGANGCMYASAVVLCSTEQLCQSLLCMSFDELLALDVEALHRHMTLEYRASPSCAGPCSACRLTSQALTAKR